MNSPIKKVLLLVVTLVISYLSAPYFGTWYDTVSPQYGSLFFDKKDSVFVLGFLLSYVVFIPLIYGLFGIRRNKKWIMWLLAPVLVFVILADQSHFYIPLLLSASALLIAWLTRLIIFKIKN